MKDIIFDYPVTLRRRKSRLSRSGFATPWGVITIATFVALFASFVFAQDRKPITINQISDLLKDGVRSSRIAQLVEQHGVDFELNEPAIRRLRADGADEVVLSAVKRMAARYTEEQQRRKRSEAEEEKRQRADAERKRQEEVAQRMDEIRRRLQQDTRGAEKKIEQEQKRQPAEAEKRSREPARKAEELARKTEETKREVQDAAKQKPQTGTRATLLSQEEVGRTAGLRNVVSTAEGNISGEIMNNSKQTLREIQLQILYSWRWKNEYHPGKDDPGMAHYYFLQGEIPPGQTARFEHKPSPPFAPRADGYYDITVKIVGFAQVFPGGAQK